MLRTIVVWGVLFWGCVFLLHPLRASPVEWEDGYKQIQIESQSLFIITTPGHRFLGDLSLFHTVEQRGVVIAQGFQVDALKMAENNVPVLALPESGTLILLGIGLAGLASLIRKKQGSL